MKEYLKANQALWNLLTRYHITSKSYDVEGFKRGDTSRRAGLERIEAALLGDVTGRSLLHLQCHFGLDTITFARRGALVTGVDFAGEAIEAARALAAEVGVPATFVCSDIYDLPKRLDGRFDIVFTSHGVLPWLPDLEAWARIITHFLAPGGTFCLLEGHPFALIFDDAPDAADFKVGYPYFPRSEPLRSERAGSYAAPDAPIRSVRYEWPHPISEIIGSLLRAGLRLTSFQEYPFVGWAMYPWMERRPDGSWQLPHGGDSIPLMFSLTATRDA